MKSKDAKLFLDTWVTKVKGYSTPVVLHIGNHVLIGIVVKTGYPILIARFNVNIRNYLLEN